MIIIFASIFYSCSDNKDKKVNLTITQADSSSYYIDNLGKSGLYNNRAFLINICSYTESHPIFEYPPTYAKNPLTLASLSELRMAGLLDDFATSYEGNKVEMEYTIKDSIPRTYYEIVDTYLRNKPNKVGQLYLVYENENIENNGRCVFVSDTTKEYGFFIIETGVNSHQHKRHNMSFSTDMSIKIKGNKILGGNYKQISSCPYRLIRDEEVNKPKNAKP